MIHHWNNIFFPLVLVLPIVLTPPVRAVQVQAEKDQSAVSQPAETLPASPTGFDLKLIGTAVVGDPVKSLVVISNSSTGSVRSYHEGDPIGNFVIGEIERETVIPESAGGDGVLTMTGVMWRRPGQQTAGAAQGPVGSVNKEEIAKAVPDYMDMVRTVWIRPHLEEGRPGGVLVYNINPESIYTKMGLVDSDVIKTVNGVDLATTQDAIDFYDTTRESGLVKLAIKRGEETQELRFQIR